MNLLRSFILVGLAGLSAVACGSDDSGGVSPSDCPAVGAKAKSIATAIGCTDTSADITSTCQQLYAAKLCTNEWAGLINCISPKPNSDFQCDADHEFEPKSTVCTAEQTTFNSCISNAK
jgi:hypothetical protein